MANITKPAGMSVIWAASGTKTPPAELKIAQGWVVELPPYQTANFIENKQDQFNGHTNMHGVPEWDNVTEYQGGLSYTKGSNGIIYKCIATNFNFDPTNPLNSNYWTKAFEDFGSVEVVSNNLATLQNSYNTLSNLTSYPTARTNLSVFSKTESDARYAMVAGNASNVFSVAPATLGTHAIRLDQLSTLIVQATESTLGLVRLASAIQTEAGADNTTAITPLRASSTFLKKSDNLASLASAATARTNLGLGTIAVEAATAFLRASNNLSDVTNATTARSNLGLTTTATKVETYFLRSSFNLSDLPNVSMARTNLGLGNAAVLNVGTIAGTVAAGNDSRIVNAVPNSRTITAGNGLTGGGDLTSNRTVTLGTPGTINVGSGNSVSAASHTHAFDITSFFGDRSLAPNGYYEFPGGFIVQWGTTVPATSGDVVHTLPKAFPTTFARVIIAQNYTPGSGSIGYAGASPTGLQQFTWRGTPVANSFQYIALGW